MPPSREALFARPIKEIARICGVSLRTVRRWRDGTRRPPDTALMLLSRDLGYLDPHWRGWTIRGEHIVSPEHWRVSRNDALSVPLLHQQISVLKAENRRLQEALEPSLDDQPLPATWELEVG